MEDQLRPGCSRDVPAAKKFKKENKTFAEEMKRFMRGQLPIAKNYERKKKRKKGAYRSGTR